MNKTQEDVDAVNNKNQQTNGETAEVTNSLSVIAATYVDIDDDNDQNSGNSKERSNEMIVEKITEDTEPIILKEISVIDPEPELSIIGEQITIPDSQKQNYRTQDSDSSDSEDDSSSSDSSSSSSSSSEPESENEDSDNEKVQSNKNRKKKSPEKGEFDDLPPIEDLQISVPEVLCDPLGEVGWIVEQMVVVTPKPNKPTLNFDTILFVDKGKRVLGRVFDVFGPVTEPHYCVRFNNAQHIEESNIKVGMTVYYCPNTPYTTLVFMTDLLKMKASDDVGEDEHPEFSDDEEEKTYYASLKQKQRNNKSNSNSNNNKSNDTNRSTPSSKRQKKNDGWKSQHPWNSARRPDQRGQNYYWYQQQQQQQQTQNQSHFYSQPQLHQNMWASNPSYHYEYQNWYGYPQSEYSAYPSYHPSVDPTRQPGPSFTWQANSTFTPTPTNSSWAMLPPPPPPPPPPSQPSQSPSSPGT